MIPQDYHVHSEFSCDCQASMAEMCRGALAKGVREIGFTEHFDLHPAEPQRDWFRLEPWVEALEACRAAFGRQGLIIRAGIELGEPHLFPAEAQALLASYPFDYALGSLHWVGPDSVFDLDYFYARPEAEAYGLYFDELARVVEAGGFDVLSHLDVPVRAGAVAYGRYDPCEHEAGIRRVLAACIARGIALDLNTAALYRRAARLTPGLEILRWYAAMGGERVTLGSDAHRPDHVGRGLKKALDAARAAGLKHLTFFERRQPRLAPIDR